MFCGNCGKEINENSRFCPKCGAIVNTDVEKESKVKGRKTFNINRIDKFALKMPNIKMIMCGGALLLVIGILVNAVRISNFFCEKLMTPEKYYQYVEQNTVNDMATFIGESYSNVVNNLNIYDRGVEIELGAELGEEGQEWLELLNAIGVDVSWVEDMQLTLGANVKNNVFGVKANTKANGDDILSGELVFDVQDEMLYMLFPEWSKNYMGIEMSTMLSEYQFRQGVSLLDAQNENKEILASMASRKSVEKCFKKYMTIILGCVEEVDKSTGVLKAEGIKQRCTKIKTVIDYDLMVKVLEEVTTEMLEDEELKDMIIRFATAFGEDVDAEEVYATMMENVEYILANPEEYILDDREFEMIVYVDGKGCIVGRQIKQKIKYSFDYILANTLNIFMPEDKGKFGYELSLEGGNAEMQITGTGKKHGSKVEGEFTVGYHNVSLLSIKVNDFDVNKMKLGYLNGSFEIAPASKTDALIGMGLNQIIANQIKDMELHIKTSSDNALFKGEISVLNEGDLVATIKGVYKSVVGIKEVLPKEKETVVLEDENSLKEWLQTVQWDKVIKTLEKTDVPSEFIDLLEDISEAVEDDDWKELYRFYY